MNFYNIPSTRYQKHATREIREKFTLLIDSSDTGANLIHSNYDLLNFDISRDCLLFMG